MVDPVATGVTAPAVGAPRSTAPTSLARRAVGVVARLGISLTTVVLMLLVLEGATRIFSHVVPPLICNDPVVGTTFTPNFAGTVYVPECDREVLLRFNGEGLRGDDVPRARRPGVRRIAIVGDSMIAAVATDEERTVVRLLEQQLNEAFPDQPCEVLNFGVSGSSTGQELVLYREVVRHYQPDLVVSAFCVANDLGDNCNRLTSNRGRIYFDLDDQGELVRQPFLPGRARITSWLNRHSRFYVWQKGATQDAINVVRHGMKHLAARTGHGLATLESGGHGVFCTAPNETLQHAWQLTEKLIETLHDEVVADGAKFLIAVLPSGWQVCDDAWENIKVDAGDAPMDLHYPDTRLGALAARLNVPAILITERFRAAAPHHDMRYEDEWLHYDGLGHFNDRGNEIAAQAFFDTIGPLLADPPTEPEQTASLH